MERYECKDTYITDWPINECHPIHIFFLFFKLWIGWTFILPMLELIYIILCELIFLCKALYTLVILMYNDM